jgi:stage II sporulation protein D
METEVEVAGVSVEKTETEVESETAMAIEAEADVDAEAETITEVEIAVEAETKPTISETTKTIAAGWAVAIAMLVVAVCVVAQTGGAEGADGGNSKEKLLADAAAAAGRQMSNQQGETEAYPPENAPPSPSPITPQQPSKRDDNNETIRVLVGETIVEMTLESFIIGSTAAEMPALFHMQALKAQAVAVRTNVLYNMLQPKARHPDAHICGNYACCVAYAGDAALHRRWGGFYARNLSRIISAVIETDGLYMTYEGKPIFAAFHSSSAGKTETCGNVWMNSLPYLVSVASPETARQVKDYVVTVTFSEADFKAKITREYPRAALRGGADTWIGDIARNESSRVAQVIIGGATIKGTAMRTMFGLRSTAFTLEYRDGSFVFTTTGYGHGVGMSQYGAHVMAARGKTFDEILRAYYTGVGIEHRGGQPSADEDVG